jgi:hypothetical protein
MNQAGQVFRKPNFFEQILNKGFGVLVGLGIGLRHNYCCRWRDARPAACIRLRSICWSSGQDASSSPAGDAHNGCVTLRLRAKSF